MDDTSKDSPDFWEWLRNRNKADQPVEQKRAQLELPKPPLYKQEDDTPERGVCIIEVF